MRAVLLLYILFKPLGTDKNIIFDSSRMIFELFRLVCLQTRMTSLQSSELLPVAINIHFYYKLHSIGNYKITSIPLVSPKYIC